MRAVRPVFVGDRLDTDIEGANNVDIDSFPGLHTGAPAATRSCLASTAIGHDLRPPPAAAWQFGSKTWSTAAPPREPWRPGRGQWLWAGSVVLDALWAIVQLTWRSPNWTAPPRWLRWTRCREQVARSTSDGPPITGEPLIDAVLADLGAPNNNLSRRAVRAGSGRREALAMLPVIQEVAQSPSSRAPPMMVGQ